MLQRVREQRPSYNNAGAVAGSVTASAAKVVCVPAGRLRRAAASPAASSHARWRRRYYRLFAQLYGACGRLCDVAMVNSSWTAAHINRVWALRGRCSVVFPPCDTAGLRVSGPKAC